MYYVTMLENLIFILNLGLYLQIWGACCTVDGGACGSVIGIFTFPKSGGPATISKFACYLGPL